MTIPHISLNDKYAVLLNQLR